MNLPIKCHKESLTNMTLYWQRERKLAEENLARCERAEANIQHYAKQITEAERLGMDGFDRERLLKEKTDEQGGD